MLILSCGKNQLIAFALQPALYEAFGLTVVEAMTCGLPTFATCHGGPAEIIVNGVSGFHIDPYNGAESRRSKIMKKISLFKQATTNKMNVQLELQGSKSLGGSNW